MFNFSLGEKNWNKVIETMTEGLMLVDPSGTIHYVNQALAELLRYDKKELIGKSCEILQCNTCFDTGQKPKGKYCGLFLKGDMRNHKCSFRRKDGDIVSVLKNATTLQNENGTDIFAVENLTDISTLNKKELVITALKRQISHKDGFEGFLGNSQVMKQMFDLLKSASRSDAPVILYGESGTGKKLAASALHNLGPRRDDPFIKVNCAAMNEILLESEFFSHSKDRFEAASGGDIFLDRIGDMPHTQQTKLLRILCEQETERASDHHRTPIHIRIIAATSKNLQKLIKQGLFREDLYYRIGVIPIHVPPLRERKEDIPGLIETFIERTRLKTGKQIFGVGKDALELLQLYNWPGNVRELINVIDYAFVLCSDSEIKPQHLPAHFAGQPKILNIPLIKSRINRSSDERERLLAALKSTNGNKSEAARILGISRVTLWKHLKKFNIEVKKNIRE